MSSAQRGDGYLPPPFTALRAQLEAFSAALKADGLPERAGDLERLVAGWWDQQQAWNTTLAERLRLYHDINNCLVGVRGNAQLLLMGPPADVPGVRQRLEVVIREATRIQELAGRLREIRIELEGGERERDVA